ncbi:uncharacterized protein RJT20DRAFT_1414 [Scheffersomyces xylosifermentans]|uniref:uncharacterized protein n=1 Tax=Scheffersomyces xylosifermentans TaxID=1304137 RepID=UPI00315CE72C
MKPFVTFFSLYLLLTSVVATPPACFLSCVSEIARTCVRNKADLTCICANEDSLVGCLVDICPYGTFLSARDHYLGTCMEHGRPTIANPHPPPAIFPPPEQDSTSSSSLNPTSPVNTESQSVWETDPCPESLETTPVDETVEPEPITNPTFSAPERPIPSWTPGNPTSTELNPWPTFSSHKPSPKSPQESKAPLKIPADEETDCDDSDDSEETSDEDSDDEYDNEVDCEWEETQSVDEDGNVIFIRRPVNVPKKYRDPKNYGKSRRVIIKKPPRKYQKEIAFNKKGTNQRTNLRMVKKLKKSKLAGRDGAKSDTFPHNKAQTSNTNYLKRSYPIPIAKYKQENKQ